MASLYGDRVSGLVLFGALYRFSSSEKRYAFIYMNNMFSGTSVISGVCVPYIGEL